MKLVEVIKGKETSEETIAATLGLAETMGKTPIPVDDLAGFVSNRVLMPMINESIETLYNGVAGVECGFGL